jgi:TonB family protein
VGDARRRLRPAIVALLLLMAYGAPATANPVPGPRIERPMLPPEQRVYALVPEPNYPGPAIATHATGRVVVEVKADSSHDSVWVRFSSRSALLDSAAFAAARQVAWRTCPGEYSIGFDFAIVKRPESGDTAIAYVANVRRVGHFYHGATPIEAVETTAVDGATSTLKALVPIPVYPELPMVAGIEGRATIDLMVHPDGKADSTWLTKSSGNSSLDAAAAQCARRTTVVGKAVRKWKAPVHCAITCEFLIFPSQAKSPYYQAPLFASARVAQAWLVK